MLHHHCEICLCMTERDSVGGDLCFCAGRKGGDLLAYPRLQTRARVRIHKGTFARRMTACAEAMGARDGSFLCGKISK